MKGKRPFIIRGPAVIGFVINLHKSATWHHVTYTLAHCYVSNTKSSFTDPELWTNRSIIMYSDWSSKTPKGL